MPVPTHMDGILFFGIMAKSEAALLGYTSLFLENIGASLVNKSEVIDFTSFSLYYNQEMGNTVLKQLVLTDKVICCEKLRELKCRSNTLEQEHAKEDKRIFNLDPGYINPHQVVLASTKFSPHRTPLGAGLWSELTLLRYKKKWHPLIWTYRDYCCPPFLTFLENIRQDINALLRKQ